MKLKQNANPKRFYVYVYRDPRFKWTDLTFKPPQENYVPFFVGKGFGNRLYGHLKETEINTKNRIKYYKIQKIKSNNLEPIIEKYQENLTEQEAYNLEEILIKSYGLQTEPCSPLTNIINGGSGGWAGLSFSDEHKRALSKSRKEKIKSGEIVYGKGKDATWFGKSHSQESKEKIGNANRDREISEETKSKLKKASYRKGKSFGPLSKEIKEKISKTKKGTHLTIEQNTAKTIRQLGKKRTESAKKNVRKATQKVLSKTYEITDPSGSKEIITNLSEYCRNKGWTSSANMCSVASGKLKHYKQYKCRLITLPL